ncbi:LysR substrate-binding domain-containing protein [Azospirillum canadense]|uniref:LysR substrate-binding domain-containing protein n=1 Tax=Azospirillum canadense TaxID=403962 RepID=UPI0022264193|nr:LysR substrate-binding domain-containing protein [Azospirillum canadense]MCW2242000.1 DNA-binding transcriptional LysR family regulator [Azospirillum canadense]
MTSRFYRLPSLTALATFEASARHRSVKRAAEELNVTPGAVSRQIKGLEEELGIQLFGRSQSGMALTSEGETLYATLSDAFRRTADTVDAIRAGRPQRPVTLACTDAFAKCWLMPRMSDFWHRFPDIVVNHLVTDNAHGFRRAEVDLRIRYGLGAWPDEISVQLFEETIYPVASPALAERYRGIALADLPALPLLHVDWVDPDWTGWDEFLRRGNIPHAPLLGRRFSNFAFALQACQAGQGVAIGWHRMVREHVAAGTLVPLTDLKLRAPGAYYLTWNRNLAMSDAVRTVRDWIVEQAAKEAAQETADATHTA